MFHSLKSEVLLYILLSHFSDTSPAPRVQSHCDTEMLHLQTCTDHRSRSQPASHAAHQLQGKLIYNLSWIRRWKKIFHTEK